MPDHQVPPGTTIASRKTRLLALVLWFFFGTIGIHRFYLQRRLALPMLILGLLGWLGTPFIVGLFLLIPVLAWWLVDLFFVSGWVREHNAAVGRG